MPTFFHGTKRTFASAMAGTAKGNGTIDRTKGGGEFGQGFYTQDSKSNALTWAQNRFPDPCILELEIDDKEYQKLSARVLNRRKAISLSRRLRKKGTVRTYVLGVDVVVGPLNGSRQLEQQKFESTNAETPLNGPNTQRRVK